MAISNALLLLAPSIYSEMNKSAAKTSGFVSELVFSSDDITSELDVTSELVTSSELDTSSELLTSSELVTSELISSSELTTSSDDVTRLVVSSDVEVGKELVTELSPGTVQPAKKATAKIGNNFFIYSSIKRQDEIVGVLIFLNQPFLFQEDRV